MSDDLQFLVLRDEDKKSTYQRREAYAASLVLHFFLIILILIGPHLLIRPDSRQVMLRNPALVEGTKQLGLMALSKDYQTLLPKPKIQPPLLQKRITQSQPVPPATSPKKLQAPAPAKSPTSTQATPPPPPIPAPPIISKANESHLILPSAEKESVEKQTAALQSSQPPTPVSKQDPRRLREISESLESPGLSMKGAIAPTQQGGSYGQGEPADRPMHNFDRRNSDFSIDQPTIVSDTQGVDFSPWLHLIYYRVRDNWFSVIPELIRTGNKGKVVVMFDIRDNGRIENLQVVRSSGLSPYDRAAVSSIKLSEPFPSFPPAFKAEIITVQFTYLYNIRTN
ncbi:MAG: energy transducer TonB [Terriglobia bacterium]